MRLLTIDGTCNTCGGRVRTARELAGLSQEQLAAKVQLEGHALTQKAVSRIESGARVVPDYEVPLLAGALNVSALWLLGIDPEGAPKGAPFFVVEDFWTGARQPAISGLPINQYTIPI